MKKLELSPRLSAVAQLIPHGARLADVGTDHAYLPVWLLQHGRIRSAVVSDLRAGPLARARATAENFGCVDQMQFCLCDGLSQIAPDAADTVVIAGMGGETIAGILYAASWIKQNHFTLLLQPMSSQPELRGWLWRNGFDIPYEEIACEGNTLYNILLVKYGSSRPMTPAQEWAGRQDADMVSPLRGQLLDLLVERTARALDGMRRAQNMQVADRLKELETVHSGLLELREEWNRWQQ